MPIIILTVNYPSHFHSICKFACSTNSSQTDSICDDLVLRESRYAVLNNMEDNAS